MVRKGENACYKQFLLFPQCFPQLFIFSASKCGIVWHWFNRIRKIGIICPLIRKIATVDFVHTLAATIINQSAANLVKVYMTI